MSGKVVLTILCFRCFCQSCWVLHCFSQLRFHNALALRNAVELVKKDLVDDSEMPVKVEAAIALQMLVSNQEEGTYAGWSETSHFGGVWISFFFCVCACSKAVHQAAHPTRHATAAPRGQGDGERRFDQRHSEDDLRVQRRSCRHCRRHDTEPGRGHSREKKTECQTAKSPKQGCRVLCLCIWQAEIFTRVLQSEEYEENEDKTVIALGLLSTIDTILTVMEDHKEVYSRAALTHWQGVLELGSSAIGRRLDR